MLSAYMSSRGLPESGVRLSLQERPAGQSGWTDLRRAVTSSGGTVSVRTTPLTSNTAFRFADGPGVTSATVTVTVVLRVRMTEVKSRGSNHLALSVSAALARPGDEVVVQARTTGGWRDVRTGRVGQHGLPVIVNMPPKYAGARVRAVLRATTAHAASVSNRLTIRPGAFRNRRLRERMPRPGQSR